MLSHDMLIQLLHRYGYTLVGGAVGLESMGVPLPGESTVIAASLYAATTHRLDIRLVVMAAAVGAILGDNAGYLVGREIGARLLARYGRHIGLSEGRLRLGQHLFRQHGGKLVFFGRFVAVLRALTALLAGANRMRWATFLFYNAVGGIVWSCIFGFGTYALGKAVERIAGPLGIVLGAAAAVAIVAATVFLKRNEKRLIAEAERAHRS